MNQTVSKFQSQQQDLQQSMDSKIRKFHEQKTELELQRSLNQKLQKQLSDAKTRLSSDKRSSLPPLPSSASASADL